MQKRAQTIPSEAVLIDYISGFNDSKGLFAVNLPKELPICAVSLGNYESLCY